MPIKLDQRTLGALPGPMPGKTDVVHWDAELPGFGLRVWASGRRMWICRYRIGARQRVISIGEPSPTLTLAKARGEARGILANRRLGGDERDKINARKAAAARPTGLTLGGLIERYGETITASQKARTQVETNRHLKVNWQPLHGRQLTELTRQDVAARLLELAKEKGAVSANRARAALSSMFSWAIKAGLAELNPVIGTIKHDERARERVLSDDELRLLWQATAEPGDFNAIVRLLLLTGQRREEIAALAWSELALDRAEWTLPGERAKNGRSHIVPLSDQVLAIIQALPRRAGRALLFGQGNGPFSGWSLSKLRLDRRIAALRAAAAGMEKPDEETLAKLRLPSWVLHDIRRSVVTHMAEIGIEPHVVEAVVNHVSGHKAGVAGVYNRATYAVEKRAALQRWADRLQEVVAGGPRKVLPMRKSA